MANATPLKLEGRFSIDDVERLVDALRTYEGSLETRSDVVVDLEAVVALDATSIAVVAKHLRALARRGHEVRIEGGDPSLRDELTADVGRAPIEKPKDDGILADIGNGTLSLYATVKDIFAFVGEVVLSLFGVAKEPRTGNYRDVLRIAERAGADAVPIASPPRCTSADHASRSGARDNAATSPGRSAGGTWPSAINRSTTRTSSSSAMPPPTPNLPEPCGPWVKTACWYRFCPRSHQRIWWAVSSSKCNK